jgi:SAM domain (Sterile alpha motif)
MLLSSDWHPHGESKVGSRKPLGIMAGAMTQPFSKTAAQQEPRGLNLDIDGWLRGIGLPQYSEMFRANDIDGELLRRLTNDDLKDIGVGSFGHRKKLLEAIVELAGTVPVPAPLR